MREHCLLSKFGRLRRRALGLLDQVAELDEPLFVGREHTAILFKGFECGKSGREIANSLVGDEEIALQVRSLRLRFRQPFANGQRLLKVAAGAFILPQVARQIAQPVIGDRQVALQVSPAFCRFPTPMFLKSNNYEANSYQRRVPCPDEPRSRKTGTGSPFPHQHSHSNNHPVKAETGCLSQRFAPSEKPKPSPETTVPPFSTRFHPRCGGPAVGVHKSLKKFLDPISPSQATVCSTLAP
jgi:hypothetical protein